MIGTLDLIFALTEDGEDRLLWHMCLVDIHLLPEVDPAVVRPGWRTDP